MEVLEAIDGRFSQDKLKPDPIPKFIIETLLSAAVQAPNHYKVRPWRFVVLTGKGRERLGDVMAVSFKARQPDLQEEGMEKTRGLPLRAPLLIAVGVDKPNDSRVLEIENICAVAAACENLLLAAHAQGLAAKWRTGDWARDPNVKRFLGFDADQIIVGFFYIGFPEFIPAPIHRPSFHDRTTWIE